MLFKKQKEPSLWQFTHINCVKFRSHSSQCGYRPWPDQLPAHTLVLLQLMYTPYYTSSLGSHSFQQWVISSAEGEKGAGKGGSFRVQVSLASSPLFSFLTVSPKHMTCFNPKPQPLFVVSLGCRHTCHFCGLFSFSFSFFVLSMSNAVRSFSSTSLRLAYFMVFFLLFFPFWCGCAHVYVLFLFSTICLNLKTCMDWVLALA